MALYIAGPTEMGPGRVVLLDDLVAACRAVDHRLGDTLVRLFAMLSGLEDQPEIAGQRDKTACTPRLSIQVLGRLRVSIDGKPIEAGALRPLHRELLAVFCTFANQVVHNDQLVEWFWPHTDPGRAQHSLQVGVSELRRVLDAVGDRGGSAELRRHGSGYRLRLASETDCDARYLENRVQRARLAHLRGNDQLAMVQLDAAVQLYRGDLIPEVGNPEWVLAERDRLRQVIVEAYEQLVAAHAAAGQHRQAVAAARAGLTHDRHRDGLWRQLVSSLLALDEPAAAAAAKRSYHQLLTGLGIFEGVRT
jgi:LuxR family maltose regulon positive regulatory protein